MKKFSTFQLEFIQLELNVIRNILKIEQPLHFTTDKKYFNSIGYGKTSKGAGMAVEMEYGLIWIDEEYHCGQPLFVLQSNLWHEGLHVKYKKKTEEQIQRMVRKLTGYS